jgi:hypothetical protein
VILESFTIDNQNMNKISFNNLSILLYLIIVINQYSNTLIFVLCIFLIFILALAHWNKLTLTISEFPHDYLLSILLALILIWNQYFESSIYSNHAWESGLHETVYPLTGDNIAIVPRFSTAYIFDSTYHYLGENEYRSFETCFQTQSVKKGDSLQAVIYCFVSKDFNGDSAKLLVKGAVYGKSISDFKIFDSYKDGLNVSNNLIYNGDFKLGTTNWIPSADSTTHTIIETPFGTGIRVSRTDGDSGDWSLRYVGRPIIYYAGHKYKFRFIYKIERGKEIPFNIGWWVDEGSGFLAYNLPLEIKKIRDGWNEASCYYTFKKTHYNLYTFLNSLQDYSVVDITNVEMKDLNRIDTIPTFVDQINNKGTWQKLTVNVPCNKGRASVCFSISKNRDADLRSLKGYVIFASPEWNK